MLEFLARRVLHGAIVVFGVTTIAFVVTRLIGDPVAVMLPMDASPEQRLDLAARLGLDRPLWDQYVSFMSGIVRFDLGDSFWQSRPALDIVWESLPGTLFLVCWASVLALVIGVAAGAFAAMRPGAAIDRYILTISLLGLSLPQFWLALLLILIFAVTLGWLPSSGADTLRHAILPIIALVLPSAGRLAIVVRSQLIDELNQAYVRTAEAKGMTFSRVVGIHAARNAANATLTIAGWEFIRMLAGYSIVVESVFAWPGLGFLAVQAIQRQDAILLQCIVFVVAIVVVITNLTLDIIHRIIDPRAHIG
jgi:peptide/nickel transport system permease protein